MLQGGAKTEIDVLNLSGTSQHENEIPRYKALQSYNDHKQSRLECLELLLLVLCLFA